MPSLFLWQSFWTVHLQPQLCEKCKNGDIWLNMIVLWLKIMTNTDPQLAAADAVLQRPLLGSGLAERARCCPGGSAPPAAAAARPRLRSWGREQPVTLLTPPRTYHLAGKPTLKNQECQKQPSKRPSFLSAIFPSNYLCCDCFQRHWKTNKQTTTEIVLVYKHAQWHDL